MKSAFFDENCSRLATEKAIEARRTCLEASRLNRNNKNTDCQFFNQESSAAHQKYSANTYTNSCNNFHSGSLELRRQQRRREGSLGKIVKNTSLKSKERMMENRGNHPLNQTQSHLQRPTTGSAFKRLSQNNRMLNEILRIKMSAAPATTMTTNIDYHHTPAISDSLLQRNYTSLTSKYSTEALNRISHFDDQMSKNTEVKEFMNQRQNAATEELQRKYDEKMVEYEQKRSHLKGELLAMKQKSTLGEWSKKNVTRDIEEVTPKKSYKRNDENDHLKFQISAQKRCSGKKDQNKTVQLEQHKKLNLKFNGLKDLNSNALHNRQKIQNIKSEQISEKERQLNKKFNEYSNRYRSYQKISSSLKKTIEKRDQKSPQQKFRSDIKSQKPELKDDTKQQTVSKPNSRDQCGLFFDVIEKQIQKDEEVRIMKHKLTEEDIRYIMEYVNDEKDERQLKGRIEMKDLKIQTEEYDPFIENSCEVEMSSEQRAKEFIKVKKIAEDYWDNIVMGRFEQCEIEKLASILGLNESKELTLANLSRQFDFNIQKRANIRSREVFAIYERLPSWGKQEILKVFVKNDQKG